MRIYKRTGAVLGIKQTVLGRGQLTSRAVNDTLIKYNVMKEVKNGKTVKSTKDHRNNKKISVQFPEKIRPELFDR